MDKFVGNKFVKIGCVFIVIAMLLMSFVTCLTQAWGPMGGHAVIAAVFLAFFALAVFLLWHEGARGGLLLVLAALVSVALYLRAVCMDAVAGDYFEFLGVWAAYFRNHGGFAALADPVGNYNVVYLYFIALMSYIDIPDLYLYKLLSILFDVILAWGCLRLVKAMGGRVYMIFPVVLLVPTVLFNSSWWAQCDAIYVALCVHAAADLMAGRNVRSVAVIGLAFAVKLQAVFLLPLWGTAWLSKRVRFRDLLAFPAAYLATCVPAMLAGRPFSSIIGIYVHQVSQYPFLTLNAPSMFAFLPEHISGQVLDIGWVKGFCEALGIGLAFTLVLALLFIAYRLGPRLDNMILFRMAVLLSAGVPFLLPQMHERYFYLADAMLLCLAALELRHVPLAIAACAVSMRGYGIYLFAEYEAVFYFPSEYASWVLFGAVPELIIVVAVAVSLARRILAAYAPPGAAAAEAPAG